MTDKVQLIKEEIERRIKEGSSKNDISEGALALDSLLDFIDSLPEEHNEDLEEEMIRWHKEHFGNKRDWGKTSGEYLTRKSQLDLAHHFAEWQEKKMLGIAEAFYQQGRYEQEQEMLKDTVELHIAESFNPVGTENEKLHGFTALYYNAKYPDFYPVTGQTIKVIPTKEVQQ